VSDKPRIGISACLLGREVRYDGRHKRDPFLVETLGPHVSWVPICPEVEAGFGTPRDPMRLVARHPLVRGQLATGENVSLIVIRTGADLTDRLRSYARRKAADLEKQQLHGFVLKKDSPSCGMERVKVYGASGTGERVGRGLFADALIARCPTLPVEEEGRLSDPALRENFIERVFAYQRLRALFDRRWTAGDLVAFHTAHKLTLMAHSPAAYRALGRIVANTRAIGRATLAGEYERGFMSALARLATPQRHANVLQHMLGYFKTRLDAGERAELLDTIEEHRRGDVPLIVPMTLVRHHLRRHDAGYLKGQTYLEPHPRELRLRNHV
jgi:uncharacterized protein YbgA (DUF1722 family)/uncharacterized protein YbbK (DUF523 family)